MGGKGEGVIVIYRDNFFSYLTDFSYLLLIFVGQNNIRSKLNLLKGNVDVFVDFQLFYFLFRIIPVYITEWITFGSNYKHDHCVIYTLKKIGPKSYKKLSVETTDL